MSKFIWVETFKKISVWLLGYENNQAELINILKEIGINNGLIDKDVNDKNIPLQEIDPFSFTALLIKFKEGKRQEIINKLSDKFKLELPIPDSYGMPSVQPLGAWLFPYKKERKKQDIPTLWALFKAIHNNSPQIGELFDSALIKIKYTGVSKLTQKLFILFPDKFFPVDTQTIPFLIKQKLIKNKKQAESLRWDDYENILHALYKLNTTFAQLSYFCWFTSTNSKLNAENLEQLLSVLYERITPGTKYIKGFTNKVNKQLALEVNSTANFNLILEHKIPNTLNFQFQYREVKNSNLRNNANKLTNKKVCVIRIDKSYNWNNILDILDYYDGVDKMDEDQESRITLSNNASNATEINEPLNQILFGPPGTGKTYATTELSVKIADPSGYKEIMAKNQNEIRILIKKKYDELVQQKRIAFTTFHQSFSYEDFIEGLKADIPEGEDKVVYSVENGVFKQLALLASKSIGLNNITSNLGLNNEPKIWKISVGEVWDKERRNKYIKAGEIRIGWNKVGNLNDERTEEQAEYYDQLGSNAKSSLNAFYEEMNRGDVVLCLKDHKSVQAIGVIESDYQFDKKSTSKNDYAHVRKVKWLLTNIDFNILNLNNNKKLVQKAVYELSRMTWAKIVEELHNQKIELNDNFMANSKSQMTQNYVLIIDEINRGNISKIFGELITLIEEDKRSGCCDAREIILPYSKDPFSIPANLYLIGTMNTADKSLAQIDLALRRRFDFKEYPPNYKILEEANQYGLDVGKMLTIINKRIQVLKGKDYQIGHSYFMPLREKFIDEGSYLECLKRIFITKIIPLLQEYFYGNLQNISLILNDNPDSGDEKRIVTNIMEEQSDLFYEDFSKFNPNNLIELNLVALDSIQRFKEIYQS
ncbi:hypothetical protein A9G13_05260 [Gilliamella sp. wkB178]|uniref:AAA family ATPase n=1 Tax=Gilliamella sp. wkB178 TaxID=3120259 RepID=UPI00080EB9B0|nr:AAA family ATPase [Gilliamella apicola]OCG07634.1 hypothetical protein A9G13_05260 [Gilliamella apicola]